MIWIKLPPSKTLAKKQIKIINLKYNIEQKYKKESEIKLRMLFNENRKTFYTIKKPIDHDFTKQNILVKSTKNENIEIKNWNKKQEYVHINETDDSVVVTPKTNKVNSIELRYKFHSKPKIISVLISNIIILSLIPSFLIGLSYYSISFNCDMISICQQWLPLLDKKLEIAGGVMGASLILPRLITNSTIRHKLLYYYLIPIVLSIYLILFISNKV